MSRNLRCAGYAGLFVLYAGTLAVLFPKPAHSFTLPFATQGALVSSEEFVGPFASWTNVVTTYSADPTGVADSTSAVQSCINGLSSSSTTCYFPAGAYKITSTLTAGGFISGSTELTGMAIIGADPSTTTIRWAGASSGTMLKISGLAYSRVNRLTFDGGGTAAVLIDDVSNNGAFDTGNQFADDRFQNTYGLPSNTVSSYGLRCGFGGNGCSEIEVIRDQFINTNVGVQTCNANAEDMWIWYSTFSGNALGVSNYFVNTGPWAGLGSASGGGNFHIESGVFIGSLLGDFYAENPNLTDVLDSYSSGANQFAYNSSSVMFARNTVLDTTQNISLLLGNYDVLIDNVIKTKAGNTAPAVSTAGAYGYFGVGNTYNLSGAVNSGSTAYYSLGDTVATIPESGPPILPGTPPNMGRTIYEASSLGLQTAICKASNGAGSTFVSSACTGLPDGLKSVAHLAASGTYTVSSSVVVPANSNAQIIGDGYNSHVDGSGGGANPVFQVNGPTQVVMRDFRYVATPSTDGIKITGADQVGGFVVVQFSLLSGSGGGGVVGTAPLMTALFSDNLSNALVEAHDLNFPYNTGPSIVQTGGNQTNVFFGATSLAYEEFVTSGSANLFIDGVWNDGMVTAGASPFSTVAGSGTFYYTGGSWNDGPTPNSKDFLTANNFTGSLAVLLAYFNGSCPDPNGKINITGASSSGGQELVNFTQLQTGTPLVNTATGNTVRFLHNMGVNQSSCPTQTALGDSGTMDATVGSILARYRTIKPMFVHTVPGGTTGVSIYSVFGGPASNVVHVTQ